MLRILLYCIAIFIFYPCTLTAQYWSKRYDLQKGNELGTQVIPTDDGLLVSVTGFCDQNSRVCGGFLKLDFEGNQVWKSIYWDTLETNTFGSTLVLDDSIFLNVNYSSDSLYYSILSFDMQGSYVSRLDYGFPSTHNWDRNISANSERIYALYQYKDLITLKYRLRLRTYDRNWILLWEKEYPETHDMCSFSHVESMPDGGAALIYTGVEGFDRRAVVVRLNKYGDHLWTTAFPKAYNGANLAYIEPSPDGGLVGIWHVDTFALSYSPNPILVFKMSSTGQIEWAKLELTTLDQLYYQVIVAQNGDIIVCGKDDNSSLNGTGNYPITGYVRRLNSNGETRWERRIMDFSQGRQYNILYNGTELANGDLVFVGEIDDTIPDDPYPANIWVVRLDSMGCIVPGCGIEQILTSTEDTPNLRKEAGSFWAFPSPFSEHLTVGGRLGRHISSGMYRLTVFDLSGKLIAQRTMDPQQLTELNTTYWPLGIYFIRIQFEGHEFQVIEVVKR